MGKGELDYSYIVNTSVSKANSIFSSVFLLLQIAHKGRKLLGFIGHSSFDALSFDVNDMWQERWPDRQHCSLRCIASEM